MKLLVIWFLVADERLHSSSLMMPLQAIARKGLDVRCIFPVIGNPPKAGYRNFRMEGVRVRLLPIVSNLWFFLVAWTRFLRRYRDSDWIVLNADDVFLFFPILLLSALGLIRLPRLAVKENSSPVNIRSTHMYYQYVTHEFSLLLSRLSDVFFVVSPMRGEEIHRKYRIVKEKIHVWPSSIDLNLFNPTNYVRKRARIREMIGVENRLLLLHHGVFSEERGLFQLVNAMAIVYRKRPDISLLLLGKGRVELELRKLVKTSGLDRVVMFHEAVPYSEVPQFIAAADGGVVPLPDQPQWRYQCPTKLLEYLAMGKPVIITDIAAHRWIAQDFPAAFYCGKGRPDDIAAAILQWARTNASVRRHNGKELAAGFSSDTIGEMLLGVFAHSTRFNDPSEATQLGG